MPDDTQLDEAAIAVLARAAGLDLGPERMALIAPPLSAWLTAANELNRMMSAPEHRTVVPATVFTQPTTQGAGE